MFRAMKMAAVAASLILVAISGARAADTATVDDTARFLAGMMPSDGSPLLPLTKDPSWQRHAKFFDNAFARLDQGQLSKVHAWADANLAAPKPTMFYMFSGPDFLYANAFYGKATTYVMAALEPSGSLPDLVKLPRGTVNAALGNIEHSLSTIMNFSFFITKHMKTDLHAGQIGGALPILFVFMERSGKSIKEVTPVTIDENGTVQTGAEGGKTNTPRGVKILFAGKDGVEKTLYYFSTDLSNSGVKSSGFLKFCQTLAPGNSLIKSASYLLHSGNFSHGARLPARQQRHHHPGRFRRPARQLQCEEVALLPVWPLCRPDRRISGTLPAVLCRAVPAGAADGFRHRLSLAHP